MIVLGWVGFAMVCCVVIAISLTMLAIATELALDALKGDE